MEHISVKWPKMMSVLALGAAVTVPSMAAARDLRFYCDIDQGYQCKGERCEPVAQTIYPARYRFQINSVTGVGSFRSCPGDVCGGAWPLKVLQDGDGFYVATYGDEIFLISPDLKQYKYAWVERDPRRSEGRHKGRCFR